MLVSCASVLNSRNSASKRKVFALEALAGNFRFAALPASQPVSRVALAERDEAHLWQREL